MKINTTQMETQLERWRLKIQEAMAMLDERGTQTAGKYQRQLAVLKKKHAAAEATLNKFKSAGSDQWEQYKQDIWIVWAELETAIEELGAIEKQEDRKASPPRD